MLKIKSLSAACLVFTALASTIQAQTIADLVQAQRAKQAADNQKLITPQPTDTKLIKAASHSIFTPEPPKYYLHALIAKTSQTYAEVVYGNTLITPVIPGTMVGSMKVTAVTKDALTLEAPGDCSKQKKCVTGSKTVKLGQPLN